VQSFVQTVLVCEQPIDLDQVIGQLHKETVSGSDPSLQTSLNFEAITHLVIIDGQSHPVGCLPIAKLLAASYSLQVLDITTLLEPIVWLPASTSLREFWQRLRAVSPEETIHWGVTNPHGCGFLGLVDLPRILSALAHDEALQAVEAHKTGSDTTRPIQTERLMLESHQKDKLLTEISHDLKNPLTAILGLFNILQQSGLEHITERQQRYLKLIDEKTHQLMAVVQEVQLLSQLQNQQLTLQIEVVEIPCLCEQAIASLTSCSQTSAVQLRIDEQIPALIADLSCLKKILSYLMRHMLVLSESQITLQVEQWGGWIGFTISAASAHFNSGQVLLSDATQKQRSPNLSSENNRVDQHLAHQLAHLHRGAIFVSADSRQNHQVTLLIPPNLAMLRADLTQIAQFSERLALIVAMDLDIIEALHSALNEQGYRAAIAQSSITALTLPHQLQPAIIFLHRPFALPSGGDVLALIKGSCHAPVITLGEASQQQDTQTFLSLPLTHQAVANCLEALPKSTPPQPPNIPIKSTPVEQTGNEHNRDSPAARPSPSLTILHLETVSKTPLSTASTLSQHLNRKGHRVISIENLEAAALLYQIWKPQVILYTGPDPTQLQKLDQNSPLAKLPLVVTDAYVATQARQITYLTIYEYVVPSSPQSLETDTAALDQILQTVADLTQDPDSIP
jgi:signal transduction histidine kinase